MSSFQYNLKLPVDHGDAKVSNRHLTSILLIALLMIVSASVLMKNTLVERLNPLPRVEVRALQIIDGSSSIESLKGNLINIQEFN